MKRIFVLIGLVIISHQCLLSQINLEYKKSKPGYYQKEILQEDTSDYKSRTYLSIESNEEFPADIELYDKLWHNEPVSQGATGTCWCFSTISFLESEIYRITGEKIKLSEMYVVYWEYVERAKAFVEKRGDVYFAQGSEATSVTRIIKKYGIVPLSAYKGKAEKQKHHNHSEMVKEMKKYLQDVRKSNQWNPEMVVSTIRSILDHYMGKIPEEFIFRGKEYTPMTFLKHIEIIPDDYFSFMSTMSQEYNQKGELVEPDNWWHCDDYYNIKVEDFLNVAINAVENGYSMSICGDISEPGFDKYHEIAVIPEFDIPSKQINEESREYRLYNKSTSDDHCIHIVGYYKDKDGYWFLIKDSNSGAYDGPTKGYRYMHEDYIRLKMMNIMVYKYGAGETLNRIIK